MSEEKYVSDFPLSKSKKIIDNPTSAKLLKQIKAFECLESMYKGIPFARKFFPKLETIFSEFTALKSQMDILSIPDQFNECFASRGWIAYESMNMDIMREAILIYETHGEEKADIFLADFYDEECLSWGIQRFGSNREFSRRIRLAELSKKDYLAGRYHACVPLLLSLLDGLINDVSKHVGFFSETADLTAWDCIAAHESGLQALSSLMTKGRNKTNEDALSIPYRHGILHGRDLAFDNKIVAAKVWAALFAARDWAVAVTDGKKNPQPEQETSLSELLREIGKNGRLKKLVEAWKPRTSIDLGYLPHSGKAVDLPAGTPERHVSEFIEHWIGRRYGLLAESLLTSSPDTSKGKRAGLAKDFFGRNVPSAYKIMAVEDIAPAVSHVVAELEFQIEETLNSKQVTFRVIYKDDENNPAVRGMEKGRWKIVQNIGLLGIGPR